MAFRRRYEAGDIPAPYQPPANAQPQPPQGSTTPPAPAPPAPPSNRQATQPVAPQGGVDLEKAFDVQRSGGGQSGTTSDRYRDPRYSPAQWGAWEEEERKLFEQGQSAIQRPGGCPPDKPFTSSPGPNGERVCTEKPDDCPPGTTAHGAPPNTKCVSLDSLPAWAGGGGGGGGGAAPAPGGAGGGGVGAGFDDMNQWWKQQIQSGGSRYTPEAMAALEADAFARARRQEKLQLDAANRDMAERGVRGSAALNPVKRDIAAKTSGQIQSDRANLMRAKIDADYQDKQSQIKNAESWVNSMRDYLLRSDANAIQREQIAAQIRLATQNINAQKDMLEQQYKNNLNTVLLTGGL